MDDCKVFGIGLSRTGTSSLDAALAALGLRTIHFPSDPLTRSEIAGHLAAGARPLRLSVLDRVDAISDTPVCCVYQGLDAAYPGSRFVLTIREEADWLRSCEAYWRKPRGSRRTGLRVAFRRARMATSDGLDFSAYVRLVNQHLYGTELFNPVQFSAVRRRYEGEVGRYFRGREDQLLTLDICSGQGWPELCGFLDLEAPATPFPWTNRLAS